VLNEVTKGVYWWRALEVERKRHINGYLFVAKEGLTLVDPPGLPDALVAEVAELGPIKRVIITGRFQERRAEHFQRCYNAELYAPQADKRLILSQADTYFNAGDKVPGGFTVIEMPNQRTPGECALLHKKSGVLVASHLVGDPPGYIRMRSEHIYHNFSSAFQAHLPLLELEFDLILPGMGTPLCHDGRLVLARYLASYGSVSGIN
jgi:hypothetical protein